MPYIKQEQRWKLLPFAEALPHTTGELNFQITQLVKTYLSQKGPSYSTINDIVGALESAKLEFYRRVAASYEDKKKEENGDVY